MPKWTLTTEYDFEAAHFIRDYKGPCGRMHGHHYRVQMEVSSRQLHRSEFCPHEVMVADFRTLCWGKQDMAVGGLDHCVLNDVLPQGYETTAEMIAQYIFEETKLKLPDGVSLKVKVSETPDSWVAYEDD